MATQKDVAKLANVSFITVSRVINNMGNVKPETREKVEAAIKQLNYYPNSIAQGLNKNRVKTLAVETALPKDQTIEETSYYTRLLVGIEKYCINKNYDILISSQRGNISDFDCLEPYYKRKADGVIILGSKPTEEQFRKISDENIPCVIIGDRHESFNSNYIDTENFNGVYEATCYLIEQGHTKIGFLAGNVWTQNIEERLKGYQKAMRDNNLSINEEWIFNGDFSKQSGGRAFIYYQNLTNSPTAIISSTDLMAIGIYDEIKDQGLNIPEAISIIGFDGHELCKYMNPPLTTLKQPLEQMGEEAAKILIQQVEDSDYEPQHIVFPVEFLQGGSVKKLN
ncbi:MAG: LacI family DNA-binding transcriptional regulator [Spirochaetales bacterium]|nr:LacI family DNA-binding transcriptional regulator [Spirochaetales bacterium]